MNVQFIPPTKRRKMTKQRAAKIFLMRNGICFTCRRQIRQWAGEKYFIEHPDPVAQGGSDRDEDLWPAHVDCKAPKDAVDAAAKAKRDTHLTVGFQPEGGKRSKLQSRGFDKAPPQRSASRPIRKEPIA